MTSDEPKRRGVARAVGAAIATMTLVLLALPTSCARPASRERVLVFAAASLQTVLDALAPAVARQTGAELSVSYAASSALARQIEQGAPADLFISADLDWMDYLEQRRGIRPDTRVNLIGNRLVLVAPAGRVPALTIAPGFPLAAAIGQRRLAMADPDAVPAGKYARAALESLGVWAAVAPRVAPSENVRAALLLVSRGEAPLGVVYRSDALADARVAIVGSFPADTHPPIVYPAAIAAAAPSTAAAARVLAFLESEDATTVFRAHGFDQVARGD